MFTHIFRVQDFNDNSYEIRITSGCKDLRTLVTKVDKSWGRIHKTGVLSLALVLVSRDLEMEKKV